MIKLHVLPGNTVTPDQLANEEGHWVASVYDTALTSLFQNAPEMLELIKQVADLQNPRHNNAPYNDLVEEQDRLADLATALLAKIEGGGE